MAEYEDFAAVARSAYAGADSADGPQISYRLALALAGFGTPFVAYVTFAVAWSIAARNGGVTNTDNGFSLVGIALVILYLFAVPVLAVTTVVGLIVGGSGKPHWIARSIVIFVSGSNHDFVEDWGNVVANKGSHSLNCSAKRPRSHAVG